MGKSVANTKILSYNDVVLRQSDLDILSGPYFLNDQIIEFYFSFLSSCYPSQNILLVPPSIAFWITNCPDTDSIKDFVKHLNLSDKELVIFPVNDNNDVNQAEGGTHWSLLAFERDANVFVHHDSCGGLNSWHAERLYTAAVQFMGASNSASDASYIECSNSPQQINFHDCGLYVTAIAKAICHWHETGECKDGHDLWFSAVEERVTPSAVAEMRNEILQLIRTLMANK